MQTKLKIVLAQLNFAVGDISGNVSKHIEAAITARDKMGADLIVFPELSITGYPPEDLLLRKNFVNEAMQAIKQLAKDIKGIYCLIGHPQQSPEGLHNACSLIYNGEIMATYAKQLLPNYGVFDEARYFVSANKPCVVDIKGIPTGIIICEDVWQTGPARQAVEAGAKLLLIPNASPFETDKHTNRLAVLSKCAQTTHTPLIYVNTIGGQDELIFDGGSMVVDATGKLCQLAGFFNETLFPVELDFTNEKISIPTASIQLPSTIENVYQSLVLGVRDYMKKNHVPGVIIGLSGGIDSALTLAIAVDALGKENVHAIYMPSRYSADISHDDAAELAKTLGVKFDVISIEPTYKAFLESLAPSFVDKKTDVTEENIQARCRAIILMALSNKSSYLVLTTGNRSELATGYCTLYGDMAGGYAVLKDIPKMMVYELAKYRNKLHHVIPERTITRAPSAELAPDQKDEDSLPPYAILDKILFAYMNEGKGIEEIVAAGFDRATTERVVKLIKRNEYKRRQGAIGPRINHKAFGRDWRYPITNGFKG